ncbi:MAG: Rieske 2Fe-2S domain-containing protein [Myxococcales bacterium]|nr:Rieske 2Fe-2S domain-containing protein [Myxococcales bacterium]
MSIDFPYPIPSGWFPVVAGADLDAGAARRLQAFDRELVLFRTESGEAAVLDAYCPHLGAHLGVGGKVEGEALRCPFHGWRFGSDGGCLEVPYAKRIPPAARARSYPTCERNGFVWAWYDPEARAPFFDIPTIPQVGSPGWVETFRRTWRIRSQIQEMGENGADSAHFPAVHGSAAVPPSEAKNDGAHRRAIQYTEVDTSRGRAKNVIEVNSFGLGLGYTHFTGICETISLNCMLPIDAETTDLTVVFLQPAGTEDRGIARAICRDLERQVGEDIPIWEHKRYLKRPVLCDGDGPIADYRRWCLQFYPGFTDA